MWQIQLSQYLVINLNIKKARFIRAFFYKNKKLFLYGYNKNYYISLNIFKLFIEK